MARCFEFTSVDAGPADAPPVLLMHGEPSWSYLYRHIILALLARGLSRDRAGPGRVRPLGQAGRADDYSYERHVAWMSAWLVAQRLNAITLFCQDWGGLIGLRLVAAFPDRFKQRGRRQYRLCRLARDRRRASTNG